VYRTVHSAVRSTTSQPAGQHTTSTTSRTNARTNEQNGRRHFRHHQASVHTHRNPLKTTQDSFTGDTIITRVSRPLLPYAIAIDLMCSMWPSYGTIGIDARERRHTRPRYRYLGTIQTHTCHLISFLVTARGTVGSEVQDCMYRLADIRHTDAENKQQDTLHGSVVHTAFVDSRASKLTTTTTPITSTRVPAH
jgi:hypothetical protein